MEPVKLNLGNIKPIVTVPVQAAESESVNEQLDTNLALLSDSELKTKTVDELKELCKSRGIKTKASTIPGLIKAYKGSAGGSTAASVRESRATSPERGASESGDGATSTKKKPMARRNKKDEELKPIKLQKPTKRVLVELSDTEKEDIRINKEAKTKIYQFLDNVHDQLRGSSVAGEAAMDDIIMFIILAKLDVMIKDGVFNIFDRTEKPAEGAQWSECGCRDHILDYMETNICGLLKMLYTYDRDANPLCGGTQDSPDLVMQTGAMLKAHDFSANFIKEDKLFHLDNAHTLKRILMAFDTVSRSEIALSTQSQVTTTQTESTPKPKRGKGAKSTSELTIDLSVLNQMDAIGTIYEYFTNKYKGNQGKDMGQYFTERMLMLMSLHLIDKQDIEDLEITEDSTMGDEFCGTFGFPLKTCEYFKKVYGIEFNLKMYMVSNTQLKRLL